MQPVEFGAGHQHDLRTGLIGGLGPRTGDAGSFFQSAGAGLLADELARDGAAGIDHRTSGPSGNDRRAKPPRALALRDACLRFSVGKGIRFQRHV